MMHRSIAYTLLLFVAITTLPEIAVNAQSPDVTVSPEQLTDLWSDLLESEPASTRAILKLSKHPASATKFLAAKLSPIMMTEQELRDAIAELGSDDEEKWRAAYRKLNYLDPRIAMGLEEVLSLEAVQQYPARHRLVDILSGRPVDEPYSATSQRYKFIKLNKHDDDGDDGEFFNFCGSETENTCGSSWWAEPKVENLNDGFSNPKLEWTRVIRALSLLESFDTPDANAIIESIATGHADAQPTKIARAIVAARNKK